MVWNLVNPLNMIIKSMLWPQLPSSDGATDHGSGQISSRARGANNLWVWTSHLWSFDLGFYIVSTLASEGSLEVLFEEVEVK